MDTLFTGDIPSNYKYARFQNNYIDLYNTPVLDGTLDYYRVYLYDNLFMYDHLQTTYTGYNTGTAKLINTSNDWHYRRDLSSIYFISFINILIIVLCINLVTSVFRKGGIFSGLL